MKGLVAILLLAWLCRRVPYLNYALPIAFLIAGTWPLLISLLALRARGIIIVNDEQISIAERGALRNRRSRFKVQQIGEISLCYCGDFESDPPPCGLLTRERTGKVSTWYCGRAPAELISLLDVLSQQGPFLDRSVARQRALDAIAVAREPTDMLLQYESKRLSITRLGGDISIAVPEGGKISTVAIDTRGLTIVGPDRNEHSWRFAEVVGAYIASREDGDKVKKFLCIHILGATENPAFFPDVAPDDKQELCGLLARILQPAVESSTHLLQRVEQNLDHFLR